jgi:hypothetical protein
LSGNNFSHWLTSVEVLADDHSNWQTMPFGVLAGDNDFSTVTLS